MILKTKDCLITLLMLIAATVAAPASAAESAWISDNLTVPLRSGPTTGHRILHRGLPSGTQLTILSRDADSDFVQIRTSRGTEGWLPSQYLVSQPIARDQLVVANRKVAELNKTVERQRQQLSSLNQGKSEADSSNTSLQRQVASLEQELAEITRISASALELSESNLELKELNARLRAEVDDLVSNLNLLEANAEQRWLMIGGGLVLVGLALGFAIKSRPRRSAWN
jgi:SH3 domain protein